MVTEEGLAKRRNKWICALKAELANVGIFGPSGDPNAPGGPTKYTLVPYEEVRKEQDAPKRKSMPERQPTDGWELTDKNNALGQCTLILLIFVLG